MTRRLCEEFGFDFIGTFVVGMREMVCETETILVSLSVSNELPSTILSALSLTAPIPPPSPVPSDSSRRSSKMPQKKVGGNTVRISR